MSHDIHLLKHRFGFSSVQSDPVFIHTVMPPRRKIKSTTKKREVLLIKRAIKRGDLPPSEEKKYTRSKPVKRGPTGQVIGSGGDPSTAAAIRAAQRMQSAFITLPPTFLEETRLLACTLPLPRPLSDHAAVFVDPSSTLADVDVPKLSCPQRPKWRFDMSKKELDNNEELAFKKWLAEIDEAVERRNHKPESDLPVSEEQEEPVPVPEASTTMPPSPTYFERNLEVWRQLYVLHFSCPPHSR